MSLPTIFICKKYGSSQIGVLIRASLLSQLASLKVNPHLQLPTNTARHGPRGGLVDQRHLCSVTLSRLLHNRHPNKIFTHATLNSLHHAVYMVPGREQMKSNRLGDSYSKKESLDILEGMCKGSDAPVKQLKERVEGLYCGRMASVTTRYRKSVANRLNIFGIGRFVDNIGLVSIYIHPSLK